MSRAEARLSRKKRMCRQRLAACRETLPLSCFLSLPSSPSFWFKKWEKRRTPSDAASPRGPCCDQCALSIASRAPINELNRRHPIIPWAWPSPFTSTVAQNHLPSSRPKNRDPIQFEFLVVRPFVGADPALLDPCIPAEIRFLGRQKPMCQFFPGTAPELQFKAR